MKIIIIKGRTILFVRDILVLLLCLTYFHLYVPSPNAGMVNPLFNLSVGAILTILNYEDGNTH